jgi:hypothetical protein
MKYKKNKLLKGINDVKIVKSEAQNGEEIDCRS